MLFPLFLSANPSRAGHSAIVRLSPGEWIVESDCVDSKVHVSLCDDPLAILAASEKIPVPYIFKNETVTFIVAMIETRGTERYINVSVRNPKNVVNA